MDNNGLSFLVDTSLSVEKQRVAAQVRQSHLTLQGKPDIETEELIKRIASLEEYIDGRVAVLIKEHPAYPWFSRVKGVGKENIGKVVAQIRIKPDPDNPEAPYADNISSIWSFCGFGVANGKAPKRTKGETLSYNSQLRSMCWRLGVSLIRATGVFYAYYVQQKKRLEERFVNDGRKVLATPQGKWVCLNCGVSWEKKADITVCCSQPKIVTKVKDEPPGVIWLGHLDAMARRKMIKLFLSCLWLAWREAEGQPVTKPYAMGIQEHESKIITPWDMIDREAIPGEETIKYERARGCKQTRGQERANYDE